MAIKDIQQKIKDISKIDPLLGIQIEMMHALGLRVNEVVSFSPGSDFYGDSIKLVSNIEGSRHYLKCIETDEQREVLQRAVEIASKNNGHLHPKLMTRSATGKKLAKSLLEHGLDQKELRYRASQ